MLAIKEGEYTGWPAPALSGDLARSLLPRFALEDGDRGASVAALRDALPDEVRAWVSAQHEVAVMSRNWCVLTPVHAALLTEPDAGSPVLSYTTSLGRLADSIDAAHAWEPPPSRAVVVTDPHPSSMAAVWVSGSEYTALTAAASSVSASHTLASKPGMTASSERAGRPLRSAAVLNGTHRLLPAAGPHPRDGCDQRGRHEQHRFLRLT